MSVRYPPIVKITRAKSKREDEENELQVVREGTQLNLICEAEGNPEQFRFKWSVDGHPINGSLRL